MVYLLRIYFWLTFLLENVGKYISPMDPIDTLFVWICRLQGAPLQAISVSFEMQSVPPRKKSGHQDRYIVSRGSLYMGVSKNKGTPKWMVKIMENPIKMDDLGVPLFLETPY